MCNHSSGWTRGGAHTTTPIGTWLMSRKEKETINTEVFKVGNVNFEWVAFPAVITTNNAEEPCVQEIEARLEHIDRFSPDTLQQNQMSTLTKPTVLLTEEVGISVSMKTKDPPRPQNTSTNSVILPQMSQKIAKENVTKPRTLPKGSSKNIQDPQTSQKGSTKRNKEPRQTSQKGNINLWTTVTSLKSNKITLDPKTEEKPQSNDVIMVDEESSDGRSKESTNKSADATRSFDNCPICLMQFPKQFSQLDMDSHLAQCLSETTVDVVW
ncbi:Fanconi anemia core complex-associated protein 20 isoform 2-T2 [Anomaloglossus baeobatrachus]